MAMVPIPDHRALEVYAAVGQALSHWTTVETDLTMTFYSICGVETRQQASAILDTIVSFDTRLAVLDALFKLKVQHEIDAELWRKLLEKCRKYHKNRHKVAHFRLVASQNQAGDITAEIAPFFSHEKWIMNDLQTLTLAQINEHAAKFEKMHFAFLWIMIRLAEKEPQTGYFEPDPEEPILITQIRGLALQSLQERAQRRPA